jgi:hypothetical protein
VITGAVALDALDHASLHAQYLQALAGRTDTLVLARAQGDQELFLDVDQFRRVERE